MNDIVQYLIPKLESVGIRKENCKIDVTTDKSGKKKGRTKRYVFNFPRLYGPIFKSGTTIVKSHVRRTETGRRVRFKKHRRRI